MLVYNTTCYVFADGSDRGHRRSRRWVSTTTSQSGHRCGVKCCTRYTNRVRCLCNAIGAPANDFQATGRTGRPLKSCIRCRRQPGVAVECHHPYNFGVLYSCTCTLKYYNYFISRYLKKPLSTGNILLDLKLLMYPFNARSMCGY